MATDIRTSNIMYLEKSLARKIAKLNIKYRIEHSQNKCTICNKELLLENQKDFIFYSLLNSNNIIKEYLQSINVVRYQLSYKELTFNVVSFHTDNSYIANTIIDGQGIQLLWLIEYHYFSTLTSKSKMKSFLKFINDQNYDKIYQNTNLDMKSFYDKSFDFENNTAIHGIEFDNLATIKKTNKVLDEVLEFLKIKSNDISIKYEKFDLVKNDKKINYFLTNNDNTELEKSLKDFVSDQLDFFYNPAGTDIVCNSCIAQDEWKKVRKYH